MKIYIVEREENTGDGFWQNAGTALCVNEKVAKREMKRMVDESCEGDFDYSEDNTLAESQNGWVRVRYYEMPVME